MTSLVRDTVNLLLWADVAVECAWLFSLISQQRQKLTHNRVTLRSKELKLIENFLSNRYQRVILNGQSSSWEEVLAGIPQGSVLGPLFFLMCINDLSCGLSSTTKLLLMIHPFSRWSMMSHNLPMNQTMILRKFQIGPTNG